MAAPIVQTACLELRRDHSNSSPSLFGYPGPPAHFADDEAIREITDALNLQFEPMSAMPAVSAARMWRAVHRSKDANRSRVVADFLIGAHALHQADLLLTRTMAFTGRTSADSRWWHQTDTLEPFPSSRDHKPCVA